MTTDTGSQTDRPVQPPYRVGFLLIDNFTLIALATAVEPLRVANQMAGTELYSWKLLTANGDYARASDGITMVPDASIQEEHNFDLVIVVAGIDVTRSFSRPEVQWLRQMARQHVLLGAVCTGPMCWPAPGSLTLRLQCALGMSGSHAGTLSASTNQQPSVYGRA